MQNLEPKIPTASEYIDQILANSLEKGRAYRYDSDIAKSLRVTKATMSQYRKGKEMSVIVAVRIANILCISPMTTICATMYHQAKKLEDQAFWRDHYQAWSSQNRSEET